MPGYRHPMSGMTNNVAESALVIEVPEAEPAVAQWRELYDPGAKWGVPAHITVVYPFVPPDTIDDTLLERVSGVVGGIEAFDFVLDEVDQFGTEVLYLTPSPQERFVALTSAIVAAWPQHQPYGGAHDEAIPHLTIAHTNRGASFSAVRSRVDEHLPIRGRADTMSLMTGTLEAASWETRHRFALG